MIALDTNILARYLLDDEPAQARAARRLLADAKAEYWIPMSVVLEVTDVQWTKKSLRKRLQVARARHASERAKLVKLADKIVNLRDVAAHPPASWSLERRREYFEWAREVIDRLRGTHPGLERQFDEAYSLKP